MITLRYVNSTTRVTVHELQLSDILEKEDSIAYVLHCFQDAGYHTATDPAQLFIKPHAGELKKLICTDVILDNSTIFYSEVIPPYGAYRVDRVNGIRYFLIHLRKNMKTIHIFMQHIKKKRFQSISGTFMSLTV